LNKPAIGGRRSRQLRPLRLFNPWRQQVDAAKPVIIEAKTRILSAVRKALDAEFPGHVVGGPWGMVVNESDTWATPTQISPELYLDLRGRFSDDVVRETLLAAGGVKVSRACLPDAKFELLQSIARRHGFQVVAGRVRFVPRPDKGKGGWCNSAERVDGRDGNEGVRNVYIASDASLAQAVAQAKQNDFVLIVLENTPGPAPYDFWLNYAAQYFGRSLLSFFPCSFRCPSAVTVAKRTFEMLAGCDATWARSFFELHLTNILYTENLGLHLFRQPFIDGVICYGPRDIDSTELTEVARLIRRGDRLEVCGKHHVTIYRGSELIGSIEGEDTGMCVFS
jgi:hypothetical protein